MSLLIFYILLSVMVSFLCSMLEAVILSVTPSYLVSLKEKKPKLYQNVNKLKDDIEKPLASILTFNTIAHTIGAAGAGAEAQRLYGSETLAIFSAILTLIILFFSEIIPKSIGATYWKGLLPISAKILSPMIILSFPLVWLSQKLSKLIKKEKQATISRDEISAIADMGLSEGVLGDRESSALKNLMRFRNIKCGEVVMPSSEVTGAPANTTIIEAYRRYGNCPYSRLPLFGIDRNDIRGYVLKNAILSSYIEQNQGTLQDIMKPMLIISHGTTLPSLLNRLLDRKEHISAIVDDGGEFLGIITLEDLIETMLGLDIMDEIDALI